MVRPYLQWDGCEHSKDLKDFNHSVSDLFQWVILLMLITYTVIDVTIAASLCFALARSRTGLSQSKWGYYWHPFDTYFDSVRQDRFCGQQTDAIHSEFWGLDNVSAWSLRIARLINMYFSICSLTTLAVVRPSDHLNSKTRHWHWAGQFVAYPENFIFLSIELLLTKCKWPGNLTFTSNSSYSSQYMSTRSSPCSMSGIAWVLRSTKHLLLWNAMKTPQTIRRFSLTPLGRKRSPGRKEDQEGSCSHTAFLGAASDRVRSISPWIQMHD